MFKKKTVILILKSGISLIILAIILNKIDWNTVVKNFKNANFFLIFIAFLFNICERIELTYKWNLLIKVRGINVTFIRLFLINMIGTFFGLFLPSSLGTDVVRGYYLVKNNSEKSISVSSVFVDRILGMFSLLLLGVISIFFTGNLIKTFNIKIYIVVLFIFAALFIYLFQKDETIKFLKKILKNVKYKKIIEKGIKLHYSILEYKKYPKTLIFSFAVTLLVQLTRILTYYFVALAFNISVPIIYFFLIVPIIMLVIMIPISIGGLGLKEGTFIAFFTLLGVSINNSAAISFTNTFINTTITLLGGLVYLFYNPSGNNITDENKSLYAEEKSK